MPERLGKALLYAMPSNPDTFSRLDIPERLVTEVDHNSSVRIEVRLLRPFRFVIPLPLRLRLRPVAETQAGYVILKLSTWACVV